MEEGYYSSELFSYFSCSRVQVRAVCGATYMLNQDEELWEKELPPAVEQLLSEAKDPLADRGDRCKQWYSVFHRIQIQDHETL